MGKARQHALFATDYKQIKVVTKNNSQRILSYAQSLTMGELLISFSGKNLVSYNQQIKKWRL